ncbi:putative dolichyl pyrophosphate Glc1Man9GlcNAc2 alpha-1,3-glucosyltransferase [Halotydeus destructor]|nr:putative dolichyl pyrophosphate Glc1Man9GlcNAc2 alpha-1,3-glucosyltransferase [Halotydeus destructor]
MDVQNRFNVFLVISLSVTLLKVLLIPSYRSTDFEVHRNWLAITSSLPLKQWYTEATSQWTLDYPPFFAYFEWLLSSFAGHFDPKMLNITADAYESKNAIYFQRATVIVSDLVYLYAAYVWMKVIDNSEDSIVGRDLEPRDKWFSSSTVMAILFLFNPGLLIVDHVHFQYNGMLSGLLLLSLARMVQNKPVESALWFAVLLNLKHIYVYIAPAYFIFLLRNYCFDRHFNIKLSMLLKLGVTVLSVTAISFGPFIATGQLSNVIRRLFPFKRGLSHAYWAPNFWAIYNTADKVLAVALSKKTNASMSSGLVQEFEHSVLPNISPLVTFAMVALSSVPMLAHLWTKCHFLPDSSVHKLFLRSVVICAYCSYLFGWHVHEKAILLIILPLTPLVFYSEQDASIFLTLSATGIFSLFPLLHRVAETPTKILLSLMYFLYAKQALEETWAEGEEEPVRKGNQEPWIAPSMLSKLEKLYLYGFLGLQMYYSFGNRLLGLDEKLPFLPLMLTSFYCSLGVIYSWLKFYRHSLSVED